MARTLKQTVVADGILYSAGTEATSDLEKAIPDKFWTGEATAAEPARISEGYSDHKVADLEAEIAARNDGRDPASETYIKPESSKKDDLIAALKADDARSATA